MVDIALISEILAFKGGTERLFLDTIHGFCGRGCKVTVIAGKVDRAILLPDQARLVHVDLSRIPKPIRPYFFDRRVRAYLSKNHFDGVFSLSRLRGNFCEYCGGTRRGSKSRRPRQINGLLDRIYSRFEETSYRAARPVVATSEMIRAELVELYGISPAHIVLVAPPVDTKRFHQGLRMHRDEWRKKWKLSPEQKAFLFVSTGHRRKGLEILQKVFACLPSEYCLLVAGTPISETKNVRSLGFQKEVQELYAACDFTILPAYYEPFGMVVTESLACGTPVLISKNVGAKDVLGKMEGLIVESFKPEAWVRAVTQATSVGLKVDPLFTERNRLGLDDYIQKIASIVIPAGPQYFCSRSFGSQRHWSPHTNG